MTSARVMKPDAKTLSLKRLAKDFGIDVLSLPISVYNADRMGGTPAYIDSSGIHIARKVVEEEPENIHVYLGHEILHSVVHNDEETGMFSSLLVNCGEDYKINQFLVEVFGYDLRGIGTKGLLLNKKFNKMSVAGVCQHLAAAGGAGAGLVPCKTKWAHHPAVFEQAMRLREKFDKWFGAMGAKATEFFHVDAMDNRTFHDSVGGVAGKIRIEALHGVNVNRVMHGLWAHMFLDTVVAVAPSAPELLTSQSIVWGLPGDKLRENTRGQIDVALLTAVNYLERVDNDALHLISKRAQTKWSIDSIEDKIKRRVKLKLTADEVKGLKARLVLAKQRLDLLMAMKPLPEIMNKRRVKMLGEAKKADKVKRQCLASAHILDLGMTYRSEVKLPNFDRSDEIIKRLRLLGSSCMKKAESTAELARELEKQFGPLIKNEDCSGEQGQKVGNTAGDKPGDGESGEPNPDSGPGKGTGKGPGNPQSRLEALQAINSLEDKLLDILAKMHEIETMLSRRHSPRTSEVGNDAVLLEYGNDLDRIVSSELALLSTEKTKLAFFAKYAEHSLLQVNPTEKRRFPVAFCIDCSGSMHGEFYTTAVGFVLAMCKLLHKDRRGAAFILFSSTVDNVLVVRPDEPFDLMKLIRILGSPSYGGTDFGPAFDRAYTVKEMEQWKTMAVMLVSDGYGSIGGLEELRARKSILDKWIGVIVSRSEPKIEGLDETWRVSSSGLLKQLVARGASLL